MHIISFRLCPLSLSKVTYLKADILLYYPLALKSEGLKALRKSRANSASVFSQPFQYISITRKKKGTSSHFHTFIMSTQSLSSSLTASDHDAPSPCKALAFHSLPIAYSTTCHLPYFSQFDLLRLGLKVLLPTSPSKLNFEFHGGTILHIQ